MAFQFTQQEYVTFRDDEATEYCGLDIEICSVALIPLKSREALEYYPAMSGMLLLSRNRRIARSEAYQRIPRWARTGGYL